MRPAYAFTLCKTGLTDAVDIFPVAGNGGGVGCTSFKRPEGFGFVSGVEVSFMFTLDAGRG